MTKIRNIMGLVIVSYTAVDLLKRCFTATFLRFLLLEISGICFFI